MLNLGNELVEVLPAHELRVLVLKTGRFADLVMVVEETGEDFASDLLDASIKPLLRRNLILVLPQ